MNIIFSDSIADETDYRFHKETNEKKGQIGCKLILKTSILSTLESWTVWTREIKGMRMKREKEKITKWLSFLIKRKKMLSAMKFY